MSTGILLIGHGSRRPEANEALHAIAAMVRDETGCAIVEVAFRELHAPNIQKGIDNCTAQGATRLLLYPFFLFAGAHVLEDLPTQMAKAKERYPQLDLILGQPLGVHRKMAEIVCERIEEAFGAAGWDACREKNE